MKKNKFTTLSDRLLHALEITGTKKADLARAIEVQPQTIQHLCYGKVQSSRFTFELATVLGLNTKWLATGEGEPFLSDDPKHGYFNEHKIIPILNPESLIAYAKTDKYSEVNQTEWTSIKTSEMDIFCVVMNDSSMSPVFPQGAKIFFKKISKKNIKEGFVIAYLPSFNSVLIREYESRSNRIYLSPKNRNLFKEIELSNDMIIFGQATECHFSL